MKKIILMVLFCLLLTGCPYGYDVPLFPPAEKVTITSEDLFQANGEITTGIILSVPVNIYNPNNYEIMVYVDDIENLIGIHDNLCIEE